MTTNKLAGKIALITGGGRGIGRATALELARHGATIIVAAPSQSELEETAHEVRSSGVEAFAYPVDLNDGPTSLAIIPQIEKQFGSVTILINSGGLVTPCWPTWTVH